MELSTMLSLLLEFPTNIFFIPFVAVFFIMLADFIFNFVDSLIPDLDFFGADADLDIDSSLSSGLILPQILKKVPLAVALCVSLFFATILSFYLSQWASVIIPSSLLFIIKIILLPIIAYLSLLIAALVLKPLAPLFDRTKSFAQVKFIGLKAKVRSDKVTQNNGEIIVMHKSNEFLLNARVLDEQELIQYGDDVIIVEQDAQQHYIVTKVNQQNS